MIAGLEVRRKYKVGGAKVGVFKILFLTLLRKVLFLILGTKVFVFNSRD